MSDHNDDIATARDDRSRRFRIGANRAVLWLSRHWAAVLSAFFILYVGLPFMAPVAMIGGAEGVAQTIYQIYNPLCHQFSFRSFFLFGDQFVYPRAKAGIEDLGSFEDYASRDPHFEGVDVSQLDGYLIYADEYFYGNEEMGYKVAYCERDIAIYGTIALLSLVYPILKRSGVKVPYLPLWGYLLIALVPIGLDGFSQLLANPPFNGLGLGILPDRESTPLLRVLTGFLFGLGNVWLAYPYLDESFAETVELIETKLRNAGVTIRDR